MNITFLIGNGFDLKIGMKTGYNHFYDYYLSIPSNNPIIQEFKKNLGEKLDTESSLWADLEEALGAFTLEYSIEDYDIILDDIREKLSEHIRTEENKHYIDSTYAQVISDNLTQLYSCLDTRLEKESTNSYIANSSGEKGVYVISFNYTQSFEKLIGYNGSTMKLASNYFLREVEHIHGLVDLNLVLGVNDTSQIANDAFKTDSYILNALVKPKANESGGHLVDRDCKYIINSSNLICLFGLSFGKTDQIWWEIIGTRLKGDNCRLIIFAYTKNDVSKRDIHKRERLKDKIKTEFLLKMNLTPEEQKKIKNKIIIGYSTDIFNIEVTEKGKEK